MFRKNKQTKPPGGPPRLHFGIRPKMMLGLLVVFIGCTLALQVILTRQLSQSMEDQIESDLMRLQSTTQVYTRQIMLLGGAEEVTDLEAVESEVVQTLVEELYAASGDTLAVYSMHGTMLRATTPSYFNEPNFPAQAFEQARQGHAAYELSYDQVDECYLYFVMPVQTLQQPVGYVIYYLDYSELQVEKYETVQTVLRITLLIMAAALLFSILVLTHFIQPLRRLTAIAGRFTEKGMGPKEMEAQKEELSHALVRRHDEVGDLSRNYSAMLDTIQTQFSRIEQDRDHIFKLLRSRQAFFDNVTHELKTPLTTIQGFAQLIQDNGTQDPELLETGLTHILNESARLHTMVLQLLEMSDQKLNYQLEPLDLTPLLTSVVEAMELKANRYQSHLRLTCPEHLMVRGQGDRLRQLVINLIDNAIKYGKAHETIDIAAGRRAKEKGGPAVPYLSVQNGGEGMTPEQMEHIFEPFYRVNKTYSREQGSAGLGLVICQKIAQEHGAQIQVESEKNAVTRFTVWFLESRDLDKTENKKHQERKEAVHEETDGAGESAAEPDAAAGVSGADD